MKFPDNPILQSFHLGGELESRMTEDWKLFFQPSELVTVSASGSAWVRLDPRGLRGAVRTGESPESLVPPPSLPHAVSK